MDALLTVVEKTFLLDDVQPLVIYCYIEHMRYLSSYIFHPPIPFVTIQDIRTHLSLRTLTFPAVDPATPHLLL